MLELEIKMGKEKYQNRVLELFNKSSVVSASSLNRIIKNHNYTKQLIRNLIKRGKIRSLTKGFYTMKDDPSLIVFAYKPAYLGLQDALSAHDLWEQESIPVVITSRKIRQGLRYVNGNNVLLRRINKMYLFGVEYIKQGENYYPYSDIEKTFIDMIYFKENINKDVIDNFKSRIDRKKLIKYLSRYPKLIRKRVEKILG